MKADLPVWVQWFSAIAPAIALLWAAWIYWSSVFREQREAAKSIVVYREQDEIKVKNYSAAVVTSIYVTFNNHVVKLDRDFAGKDEIVHGDLTAAVPVDELGLPMTVVYIQFENAKGLLWSKLSADEPKMTVSKRTRWLLLMVGFG